MAGHAGDGDLAAHDLREQLGDGQAEAEAGRRLDGRAPRSNGSKMRSSSVVRNADAGVLDLEGRDLAAIGDRQTDMSAASVNLIALDRRLMRICRSRFSSVRTASGSVSGRSKRKPGPWPAACRRNMSTSWSRNSPKRRSLRWSWKRPGLDLGDVEQAVDQAGQMLGAAPDHAHAVLSRRRDRLVALEDLGIAEHGVERRAQFVAEPDDIAALGEVGGLRRPPWRAAAAASVRLCASISLRSSVVWRADSSCATRRLSCASTKNQATMPATISEDEEGDPERAARSRRPRRAPAARLEGDQIEDKADRPL